MFFFVKSKQEKKSFYRQPDQLVHVVDQTHLAWTLWNLKRKNCLKYFRGWWQNLFHFHFDEKKIKLKNTFLPEVLYSSCLSLEQAFKFQIRFFFIEKNYFHIDIISGWMEKICQKCLDRFVIYVSTNQYKLPAIRSIFASIPLIGKVIT